jgi:uncharacterized protein (TIGR02145 family)
VNVSGQKLSIDLSFTATNNTAYVKLDSIKVMNRSQGGESIIYYPDTTLSLEITPGDTLLYIGYSTGFPVGVREIKQENSSFHLFQSYPNPVNEHSMISMYIPRDGIVSIMGNDIQGRVIFSIKQQVDKGIHFFRFSPGNSSLYFLSALWEGMIQSIKIINTGTNIGKLCMLDYVGSGDNDHSLKTSLLKNDLVMQESGILDSPAANETYTFQFATNIPCPGTPTVTYEGQVYNTIQIFSQCWLKENLNVGTMISGSGGIYQTNNDIKEKYCYENHPDSCTKYGGLYQWDEMMQYTTEQGTQGICPPGWHIPTDEEWKVLEGAADSQYGIGDAEWDLDNDNRGFDAGKDLKTTSGWYNNGNGNDIFGFSGRPGGGYYNGGAFYEVNYTAYFWTSSLSPNDYAGIRNLINNILTIYRYAPFDYGAYGCSVRCLKND